MRYSVRVSILEIFLCLGIQCALGNETSTKTDGVVSSFVVLGDNQVASELVASGDASAANIAQFRQNLKDISVLEPKPSCILIVGDMVDHGGDEDGKKISDRLNAWTKLYKESCSEFGLKIPLVPIPGNHEIMKVVERAGKPVEDFNPSTHTDWLKWLKNSGFDRFAGNGPEANGGNPDLLAGDDSRITYSFDDADGNHFIVIDTFTLNNQAEPPRGWIPYHWIAEDARKAEANPRVRHIFAFGHMPIRIAGLPFDAKGDNSILNSESSPLARQLLATFGGLSKFGGYFCGHLHLWDCSRLPDSNDVWQVIAGNAGSRLIQRGAGAWQAPFYFGFTVVQIHGDGQVGVVSHNRPVPDPYYSTAAQPPAKPQTEIMLTRNRDGHPAKLNHGP